MFDRVGDSLRWVKVGCNCFCASTTVDRVAERGYKVFLI